MKTTLDLPESLVRQVKLRAVREGRKPSTEAVVGRGKKTGLTVIECKRAASPEEEMTPERVADILLAQEVRWQIDAGR